MLDGKTVYFLGKLAASNRKEATGLVRRHGGKVARTLTPDVRIVVVGEGEILSRDWNLWNDQLNEATREAFEAGSVEIVAEATFWERLGAPSGEPAVEQVKYADSAGSLYTPSMLAELTGLTITSVRRLQQESLIVPVLRIHRLCYFDFKSLLPLKIVRGLLDAGMSFSRAVDQLRKSRHHFSNEGLDVRLDGRDLLFVDNGTPVDQDGQKRFAFVLDSEDEPAAPLKCPAPAPLEILESIFEPEPETFDADTLCEAAWMLEADGNLQGAVDLFRTALAVGGPSPQIHFQIAELLYRLGDPTAARERYFMAIELDEEFVEARANLGCVLVELGNDELAAAAFRGALKYHPDYAEVHFHLGMLLKRAGLPEEADRHLRLFLEWAPDSPWTKRIVDD